MKRTELKRKTPLSPTAGSRNVNRAGAARHGSTLKRGRGFAASPAQREKVAGRACVACGRMQDDYTSIDPAHICARGLGGCDDAACVIPLCRTMKGGCHFWFDRGELDILRFLEPSYRAEVAHAVTHLGLDGTRRRLCPSQYVKKSERKAAA